MDLLEIQENNRITSIHRDTDGTKHVIYVTFNSIGLTPTTLNVRYETSLTPEMAIKCTLWVEKIIYFSFTTHLALDNWGHGKDPKRFYNVVKAYNSLATQREIAASEAKREDIIEALEDF